MAGIIIYKSAIKYENFFADDDNLYNAMILNLNINKHKILWGKGNLNPDKVESSKEAVNDLVKKLNENGKVDLKKELKGLFE